MYRKTYAEINLDHLKFNLDLIRTNFPNDFLCPMVKANAYGHGDVQVARFLEDQGVQHLGVCLIEEGLLLRNFGIKAKILVFRGFDLEGARKILQYQMTPVVSSWAQLEHLEAAAAHPISVHIKFNTGMNRLGFAVSEAQKVFDYFWQNKKIRAEAICTHLSQGEDGFLESGHTVDQIRQFSEIVGIFKALAVKVHVLNSAGILSSMQVQQKEAKKHPLYPSGWGLRPGLIIYGYNPIKENFATGLKPVMSLKSQVGVFRQLKAGEGVSYNSTWRASKESVVAVVPIGYADGYHRTLSNRSQALFLDQRVPVIGNICMDYLILDVTTVAQEKSFDPHKEHEVTLFGASSSGKVLSASELAVAAQTITWEILTSVGERVPRIYRGVGT